MIEIVFDNNGEVLGTFEDGVSWTIERIETYLLSTDQLITGKYCAEAFQNDVDIVIRGMINLHLGKV